MQCCYLISQVMSRSIRSELKQEIAPLSIQASSIRKINTRNQSVSQIMPRYQSHKDETVRCCNLALLLLAAASSKAAKDPLYLRIYANQLAHPWNNGKSGAKLDLTSSTTTGLQIRVIGCRVAVPRSYRSVIPTPLFIYISQLLRDSFSVSQQPPIWDPCSHYSMLNTLQHSVTRCKLTNTHNYRLC